VRGTDEGAFTLDRVDDPFVAQHLNSPPGGCSRDAEFTPDVGLARNDVSRRKVGLRDPLPDDLCDLEVEMSISIMIEHVLKIDEQEREWS
jgi:hypothetical protein